MSAENDVQAGADISSLASVTQAQMMQMVNQSTPLSNRGLIICFAGSAGGAAGVGFPDITNNPRFVRYLWIDTEVPTNPVIKRYSGIYAGTPANPSALSNLYTDWTPIGVAAGAITTAMMAALSATGGIPLTLLKRASNGAADASKQYFILRVDSAGQYIEAVVLDTALADGGGIALARLNTTGIGAQKYLGYSGGALAYRLLDPPNDITAGLGNRIPAPTCIIPGTAFYLLRSNGTASAVEWIATNAADLFRDNDIGLSKLAGGGAGVGDFLKFDGAVWVKFTPSLDLTNAVSSYNPGTPLAVAGASISVAHGYGTVPKLVRGVIVCTVSGVNEAALGYAVGDEVDVNACFDANNNQAIAVTANAATIYMGANATTNFLLPHRIGTTAEGIITAANWKMRLYYWK